MQDLRTVRELRKLTQDDLAEITGISQPHLASIESGKHLPNSRTRKRLERILGSEINWLTTLAQDRGHIGFALRELINAEEPGATERIKYCRQYLNELEKLLRYATTE